MSPTAELIAVTIYEFQITSEPSEFNQHSIIAMCNEMTHLQDFQGKRYELGWEPNKLRWIG